MRAGHPLPRSAVVIGAGVSGLAVAALLSSRGVRVTVVEKNGEVGGRAGRWKSDGFAFDTGPSWYLMPEVFEHYYRLLGTSSADQLDLVDLKTSFRVFTEGHDGSIDLTGNRRSNMDLFEQIEPGAGAALADYLDSAQYCYRLALDQFLYTSYDSLNPFLDARLIKDANRLVRLLSTSMESFIAQRFSDDRLRKALGYPAVFLGTDPARAPALYHIMSHLDLDDGVRYPMGGFGTFVESLKHLALANGATILTDLEVLRVEARGRGATRRARGIVARGAKDGRIHRLQADVVISAADVHHTETVLLPPADQTYPERYWERRDPGPGAVTGTLGIRGKLPELEHHNLFLTSDWRQNFASIFGSRRRMPHPASIYVSRSSQTDPSAAPDGHENLFVLIPCPANPDLGGAGSAPVEQALDDAIRAISTAAGVSDLAERVVVRRSEGPADFQSQYHSWRGGALGPGHVLRQSAFFRTRNRSKKIKGLYYAGATTLPGVGLPMCLISAELVLKRLLGDTSAGPLGGDL